jgi:hypothetical protein
MLAVGKAHRDRWMTRSTLILQVRFDGEPAFVETR